MPFKANTFEALKEVDQSRHKVEQMAHQTLMSQNCRSTSSQFPNLFVHRKIRTDRIRLRAKTEMVCAADGDRMKTTEDAEFFYNKDQLDPRLLAVAVY